MAPHFGSRVSGDDAYDKAVRNEKAGGHAFGVRVTGAITGDGPMATAKRATEHGPLVVAGAQQSDTKGNPAEGVSIDELRNMLAENPTTLDSLYESELARESGPRDEALHIIREVERGIKGAGRREVLDEIAGLLGETAAHAASRADLNKGFLKAAEDRAKREAENLLLTDAARVKAMKERDENLDIVKQSSNAGTQSQIPSSAPDTLAQAKTAAGLDDKKPEGRPATVPTKPEGPIQPETQSAIQPLVSKGEGEAGTTGQSETDGESDGDRPDIENATVADLKSYLGDEELEKLNKKGGSGADGAVVRADLVKAAKRVAKSRGQ
jgi:hypothetical protein